MAHGGQKLALNDIGALGKMHGLFQGFVGSTPKWQYTVPAVPAIASENPPRAFAP